MAAAITIHLRNLSRPKGSLGPWTHEEEKTKTSHPSLQGLPPKAAGAAPSPIPLYHHHCTITKRQRTNSPRVPKAQGHSLTACAEPVLTGSHGAMYKIYNVDSCHR